MANIGLELVYVLVRDREADPEFAQLREHGCHVERRKALEFVDATTPVW